MELQGKIIHLHNLAHRLLHIECSGSYLYADDLSQLNKDIHDEKNE
ncbi:UpxZ family transcription anti-terminator antagonist [Bacteroides thetaiotaomicron]